MRIYNGTNSLVTLPITGTQQITINPKSVSIDFMGGTDFISMLVTSFDPKEVALVVSGPYELSVCATVPTAVNYVVQTLDEAIQRFAIPTDSKSALKQSHADVDPKTIQNSVSHPDRDDAPTTHPDRDDDPANQSDRDDAPKVNVEETQDNAPKEEIKEEPTEEKPVEEKPKVEETQENAPKTTKRSRKAKKENSESVDEGK